MTDKDVEELSYSMARAFVAKMDEANKHFYVTHPKELVNMCLPNALAMAVGGMLSGWCLVCKTKRKDTFDQFDKLAREYAKEHKDSAGKEPVLN